MKRLLLVLAACGSSGSGNGGGADGPGGHTPPNTGSVLIQSYSAHNIPNTPIMAGNVTAEFALGAYGCTTTSTTGSCDVLDCSMIGTTPAPHSAGTLTVTGAAMPVSITPGSDGSYATFMSPQVLFNGGESLTFAASGAEVPAFSKSLTAPAKATITSPAKPDSASPYLNVTRSAGFTVTWTGGGSGTLFVSLDGGANRAQTLFCRFDASAGSGTIPADTLMMLPAGQGGFAMAAIKETTVDAGDWRVNLEAYYNAVWPDDAIVSGPTMLQ